MAALGWRRFQSVVAACLVLPLGVVASPAYGQTFVPEGPAPTSGSLDTVYSGDGPDGRTGTVTGAVQSVLTSRTDPNTLFIGATNGGVWVTRNAGASWTPLTDSQSSLSIGSMTMDQLNANRIYAGIGSVSNGNVANNAAGKLTGILYSPDGGSSWSTLGGLAGESIVGLVARGETILAASAFPSDTSQPGGLFRSDTGGASFGSAGLAAGQVTALVADAGSPNVVYAALGPGAPAGGRGIYRSDIGSTSWTRVLSISNTQAAKLATGPGGSVAAAVYDTTSNKIVALYWSPDSGASWRSLAAPPVNPGGQAPTNLSVAIDPANANIIYVGGDASQDRTTLSAYRIRADSGVAELLTDSGTANGSTVHADVRAFAFDSQGRLLLGGDGGLYVRSNPQDNTGAWTGLNGAGLAPGEAYAIAYDARSKRILTASQDTGSAFQSARGGGAYTATAGADGTNAQINDTSYSNSILYFSTQQLGLIRTEIDAQGRELNRTSFATTKGAPDVLNFDNGDFVEKDPAGNDNSALPFGSKMVLNRNDPRMIAIGTMNWSAG